MLQWFRKQPANSQASNNGGDLHIALTRKLIDFLSSQISAPKRATSIMSHIARFKELPPTYQEKELPGLYLKIEQYLVDEDQMQKFTKAQLRKTVKYRYEPLMELENFSIIFEGEKQQELLLSQLLLKNLILRANSVVENEHEATFAALTEWIFQLPDIASLKMPFNLNEPIPTTPGQWINLLVKVSQKLYYHLEDILGEAEAASLFEKSYREIAETYRPLETFYVVVQLMPDKLLDENKIGLLTGEQIRNVFLNKVSHLQKINDELSETNGELKDTQSELIIAQDTAMESVKLFHSVLNTVEEGIVTADSKGKIILVNDQILKIFGYEEEELAGKSIEVLMPEKYREQHRKGMERYFDTQESRAIGQRLILEGLRKDKSVFPLELQITETRISDRIFFTAAMHDISQSVKNETELKKLSDDLRRSEQKYRSLIDTVQDIIFTLSLDGNFITLNPAFDKLTEWRRDEWLGKPFTQIVHPDDSLNALKLFQLVLQNETPPPAELRIRQKSDQYIAGEFNIVPQIQNGKMIGAMGIARIATHSRKEEVGQKLNDKRYVKFLESSSDAILLYQDGKLVFANPAAATLLGADTPQQLLNKSLLDIVHPDHHNLAKSRVVKLLKENADIPEAREKLLQITGETVSALVSAFPVMYNHKPAIQYLLRSESVPAPEAPAPDMFESLFAGLFDHAPDALLVTDPGGKVLEVNPAASRLYGLERDEMVGKSYLQRVPHPLRDSVAQNITLLTGGSIDSCESINTGPDGRQFPVRIWGRQITYFDQTAIILTIRDISRAKKAQEEQERQAETVSSLETRLNQGEAKHRALATQLNESATKYHALETRLNETETKYRETRVGFEAARRELENARSQLETRQRQLNDSETALQQAQAALEQAQNELKDLKTQFGVVQARLQSSQINIKNLQTQAEATQTQYRQLEARYAEAEQLLNQTESEKTEWQEKYQEAREELEDVQQELTQLNATVETAELNAREAREQLAAKATELQTLQQQLETLTGELAQVQSEKEGFSVKYNEAIARLHRWQLETREAQENLEKARSAEASLKAQYEQTLKDAEANLQKARAAEAALKEQYAQTMEELRQQQQEVREATMVIESAQSSKSELQAQYQDSQKEIQRLRRDAQEMREALAAARNELETLQAAYESTQSELETLKEAPTAPAGASNKTGDYSSKFEETEFKLVAAQAEAQSLLERYEVTQRKLQEIQTRYLSNQARLQNAQNQIRRLGEMLPVCQCRKIRDDHEYWTRIQEFANDPANAEYLTGVCPNCPQATNLKTSPNGTE